MNDFRTLRSEKSVAVVVDGTRLFVPQTLLDSSPVFIGMLQGNRDEIALPDVLLDEFVEMLNVLGASQKSIDGSSCEFLLKLADRFQMDALLNKLEQFIIVSENVCQHSKPKDAPFFSTAKKLLIAEKYCLAALQDNVLNSLVRSHEVKAVAREPEFKDCGEATKSALFDRICQFP